MFALQRIRIPKPTIANSAITMRSAANCMRQVRLSIEPKQWCARRWHTKFRALFRWTRPLRIRHLSNHFQWKKGERSRGRQNARLKQLARQSAPSRSPDRPKSAVPRLIGRVGRPARLSAWFPPAKFIAWRITGGRFQAATQLTFTCRTSAR